MTFGILQSKSASHLWHAAYLEAVLLKFSLYLMRFNVTNWHGICGSVSSFSTVMP